MPISPSSVEMPGHTPTNPGQQDPAGSSQVSGGRGEFRARRVAYVTIIAVAVLVGAAMLWMLRSVLLLGFAAILVAVGFRSASDWIARRTGLTPGKSLAISVVGIVGTAIFLLYHFGGQFSAQMQDLAAQLPEGWSSFKDRVGQPDLDQRVISQMRAMTGDGTSVLNVAWGVVGGVTGALAGLLIAIVAGVYLAAQPGRYIGGFVRLFPAAGQIRLRPALTTLGVALRLWLVGQLFAMALVGILAGLGLWLIGIPSALALGLIAGLLEFVPVVGPIASAVPAVLLAMLVGWEESLMVAGLYLAIQQMEGYVITPLVQQRAVDLPPAFMLFSLIALGTVFGIPGVLLAAPLTVVLYVGLKTLYLREAEAIITPT